MNTDSPDMPWSDAAEQLTRIAQANLLRTLHHAENAAGRTLRVDGRELLNFSSNNYLDLAADPRVADGARLALEQYGAGAGGSRLITGSLEIHRELEEGLARFKGAEAALVFSSGYLANIGALQALSMRADGSRVPVFFDRLSHASIVDAVMLSGSRWRTFPHNDPGALEKHLERTERKGGGGQPSALVVTEGVFSMDGDLAPLPGMLALCERHGALLVVDDAHGTGVVGEGGRGAAALLGVAGAPRLVQVGTLSKAFGVAGGFVAGTRLLRDLLVNRARAFVFDTALAPPCAGAALAALNVIRDEPDRIGKLARNSRQLRNRLRERGFPVEDHPSAIIPVVLGDAGVALDVATRLRNAGFLVVAIRPPTVPRGTSRIRVTVMATHEPAQVEALVNAIANAVPGTPVTR